MCVCAGGWGGRIVSLTFPLTTMKSAQRAAQLSSEQTGDEHRAPDSHPAAGGSASFIFSGICHFKKTLQNTSNLLREITVQFSLPLRKLLSWSPTGSTRTDHILLAQASSIQRREYRSRRCQWLCFLTGTEKSLRVILDAVTTKVIRRKGSLPAPRDSCLGRSSCCARTTVHSLSFF